MPLSADKNTGLAAVSGGILGAKNCSAEAAFGISLTIGLWDTYRTTGKFTPTDGERFAIDLAAGMAAWWLMRKLVQR